MENQNEVEKCIDAADKAFYPLLKVIFGVKSINKSDFEDKIEDYIKLYNLSGLILQVFELFLYLNPLKKNFNSEINKRFIINVLKALLTEEELKEIFKKYTNNGKDNGDKNNSKNKKT